MYIPIIPALPYNLSCQWVEAEGQKKFKGGLGKQENMGSQDKEIATGWCGGHTQNSRISRGSQVLGVLGLHT